MDNAAHHLLGRTLGTGWRVIEKIQMIPGQTGSFFSVCYKIEKDGDISFLKAFDFAKFFHVATISGTKKTVLDIMGEMIAAYRYERDLSEMCRDRHVTKVAFVKESGEEVVQGYAIPLVPYLIFDLADGDIRKRLILSASIDVAWKLSSLHSVAVGLKQLHAIDVSHQDLKPSNVLLFKDESKLGDLGRSISKDYLSPYGDTAFNGDWGYAPTELLYAHIENDWKKRAYATDCYLLGSMIVFYFAGVNINALIRNNLHDSVSWEYWSGSFEDVKAYVIEAFYKAIDDFEQTIDDPFLRSELKQLVEYLCYPIPEGRGHIKNVVNPKNQYDLQRFIARLDYLHRKMKIKTLAAI